MSHFGCTVAPVMQYFFHFSNLSRRYRSDFRLDCDPFCRPPFVRKYVSGMHGCHFFAFRGAFDSEQVGFRHGRIGSCGNRFLCRATGYAEFTQTMASLQFCTKAIVFLDGLSTGFIAFCRFCRFLIDYRFL